jgi:hypothetical protein
MRTTVNLPDELVRRAKKIAAESRTTLTALIEEGLHEAIARRKRRSRGEPLRLSTYGAKGPLPGVDLDDSAALLDLMDDGAG